MRNDREDERLAQEGGGGGSSGDSRAADLFWEYIERLNRGEDIDEAQIRRERPDDAEEILRQIEAFQDIGAEGSRAEPLGTLGDYTLRRKARASRGPAALSTSSSPASTASSTSRPSRSLAGAGTMSRQQLT